VNDDVTMAVMTWLLAPDQDFFAKGFNALVFSWDKSLSRGGDYSENVTMSIYVQTIVSL
jgi:hypothetical protein